MHVALVSPAWPASKYPNGIVTYVHHLRSGLISEGHRVSVFANDVDPANKDQGIYLIAPTITERFRAKLGRLISDRPTGHPFSWGSTIASTISRVHRSDPIDIVEMEESFGWCATVKARVPVPIVVKLHGPAFLSLVEEELETSFARTKIEIEGEALRQIDTIISPSRSTLSDTLARYVLNPKIQCVVVNPVIIEPSMEPWDIDRCDKKTILFVGRFDKRKGGDMMLLAFRKLLAIDANLKLIFVGPDNGILSPHGARIHFDEFKNSLFNENQSSNIRYLGTLPRAEIFSLRRRAMLTMVLARWENQANTALEAMIQGCPVIAADTGGMSEIIDDGVTGLLAPQADIDELCEKVLFLLRNPSKARQLGDSARRAVIDRHSARQVANATLDVYRQAIADRQMHGLTLRAIP